MSSTLVVDTTLQATQQASDFSVLGFKSILPTSTNTPEELTIDTFRDGVRPLLLSNPLTHILAPGNAEKFLTNGTLTTDRATIGTFIDKNDGLLKTAAIDTIREESEGFLIEGDSTNPLLRSEEFDNGVWFKNKSSVTANAAISPDGNMTAAKLIPNTDNDQHDIRQTVTTISAAVYTTSVFIKSTGEGISILLRTVNGSFVSVKATDGSIISQSGLSANVSALVNGWFRITVTDLEDVGTSEQFRIQPILDDGTITFASDGVNGVYIWGAQLEKGLPFASSYIKTTTTAVTRAADDVSIPASGNMTNHADEHSFLYTVKALGFLATENQSVFSSFVDDAFNRANYLWSGDNKTILNYLSGPSFGFSTANDREIKRKIATTYDGTTLISYSEGVSVRSDVAAYTDADGPTTVFIGRDSSGLSFNLFGHISDFMIFERALNQLEIVTVQSGAALPATNSSVEDPLFPFVNTLDFRDNTKYSPLVTSGTVVIEFNQSVVQPIDYFAFAIHNSQDAGLTGKLEVDTGAGFEIVAEFASVKNNRPFLKFFGTKNTQRQKLTLNFNSKLFIGTIFLGEAVTFDRTPSLGFKPGRTAPLDTVEQFTTDGNNFIIGRRINKGFNEQSTFRFVKFDDIDLFYEDFQNHVLDSKPVFFQWSQTKNQTIFGLQNARTMTKPQYVTSFHADISFDISGYT